jgi:hypothetical protein
MKSLTILKKESTDIQMEISELLLDNYRSDNTIEKHLNVIATITMLRQNLAIVQREIRERLLVRD